MYFCWSIIIAYVVVWPAIHCYSFFMYFIFILIIFFLISVMLYYSYTQTFSYCIAGIVIVCHFVRSLMAFVCQEIKGLLTYLRTRNAKIYNAK